MPFNLDILYLNYSISPYAQRKGGWWTKHLQKWGTSSAACTLPLPLPSRERTWRRHFCLNGFYIAGIIKLSTVLQKMQIYGHVEFPVNSCWLKCLSYWRHTFWMSFSSRLYNSTTTFSPLAGNQDARTSGTTRGWMQGKSGPVDLGPPQMVPPAGSQYWWVFQGLAAVWFRPTIYNSGLLSWEH